MMSRFSQALRGKTGRCPNARKAVLVCLIGVGVGYSRMYYPQPPKLESALRVVMRLEEIPDSSLAADLCRRILRAQAMTAAARAKKEHPNDAA